jgi:hypothetical protein
MGAQILFQCAELKCSEVRNGSFASFSFPPRDARLPSDTRCGSGGARLAVPGE